MDRVSFQREKRRKTTGNVALQSLSLIAQKGFGSEQN
jgi:hypothetical protein